MENNNHTPGPSWKWAIPFFVTLGLLSALAFCLPLRPDFSQSEKRELAKFPNFTWEALWSGDYFDDITLWFSDTFPGREGWLNLSAAMKSAQGYSDIAIEGQLPEPETIPPVTQPVEPQSPETAMPAETQEQTSQETTDSTESWGGLDAADDEQILFGGSVIQIGDSVFNALGFSQQASDHYVDVVNRFTEAVSPLGTTVVSAPPPTAVGILVEEAFQEKLRSVSQVDTLAYLHDSMDSRVVKVDTVGALLPHNSEYLYFRTDHHWTALGAYYSYQAVCQALDMEPVDISTMEVWDQGVFHGSLFGRARNPGKLKADTVYAYVPKGDITATAYSKEGNGREITILQDASHRDTNAKYLVFGTDYSLNHVVNHSLADAPDCLVIKDSFGNCFVPFLTQNFHNIYSVDYRKFRNIPLTQFVEQYGVEYVIFMPYMTATQSGQGWQLIESLCF